MLFGPEEEERAVWLVGFLGNKIKLKMKLKDFPGGPVVKILHFHCRGHGFDPWSRN